MPSKPLDRVLYRELSVVQAKDTIDVACPLLQELVNYGTNALARCATSVTGRVEDDLAILALYRHIIEMTDGIEVLLSHCCPIPAVPLLRSSFEGLLSMEYILEDEEHYVSRSLSWLVVYAHQRLAMYERLDPSTPRGARFKSTFEDDQLSMNVPLPPAAEVQRAQANLQSLLAKPHLQPVEAEYKRHRRPRLFQLFDGPANLHDLAAHLRRGAQYEFLYRRWSAIAHSQDLALFLDRAEDGGLAIGRLRDPSEVKQVASLAASFILRATRFILGKLRSGEDIRSWYGTEVRERYMAIARTP